jgi:GNAT superfamily N-acetyltransferase
MESLEIVYKPLPDDGLLRFLQDHIVGFNHMKTGNADWHPVCFFLKSQRGEWLGGISGYVWGGWLHINLLWVSEALRGHGQGTRLMDAAEDMAKQRGAIGATVETFSFQAPGFYAGRGYTVFGRIDDYPPGHTKLFLSKRL